jgi:hypothetical protein
VSNNSASHYSTIQSLATFGCLPGPILNNPLEDPAWARPNELLVQRQFSRFIDQIECTINHRRAVEGQHIGYSVRISNVEMSFAHHDDLAYSIRFGWSGVG